MNPDDDPIKQSPEDGAENIPQAGGSRWKRLKQFFISRYLRVIDGLSNVLKRLRNRVGKRDAADGEAEEKGESRTSQRKTKTPHAEEAPVAAPPPAPRSLVRSIFIYLLVLIIGIIAGMTFSFTLLSNMVINQAQKIGDQRDEIMQLEKLHSNALESEAKYRKRLTEIEAQLNQLTRTIGKESSAAESVNSTAATAEKSSDPKKTANCKLESGNAEALARCLDEFNRKGSR